MDDIAKAKKIKWVLFDLDGTLVDSLEILYGVYLRFLKAHGVVGTREEFNTLSGSILDITRILKSAHRLHESLDALEKDYFKRVLDAYSNVKAYPESETLLRQLKEMGCKLIIVTSARKECVEIILKSNHWEKYFSDVICGTDVPKTKPAPNIYNLACHKNGIDRECAVVLEDSVSGVQSAINAGIYCIRINHDTTKLSDVLKLLKGTAHKDFLQSSELLATGNIAVVQVPDRITLTPKQAKRIEEIWLQEKEKNPQLFNGKVAAYLGHSKKAETTLVSCTLVEYKQFLAQLREPILDLNIKPLSVSSITILKEKNASYALFAFRSENVTEYPCRLELVPSGGIDASVINTDGNIRFQDKLREEFEEETGIKASKIKHINSIGLIIDRNSQVYDVCCSMEVDATREEIMNAFPAVGEYRNPCFIPIEELEAFLKKNESILVPTSLALAHAFQKGANI